MNLLSLPKSHTQNASSDVTADREYDDKDDDKVCEKKSDDCGKGGGGGAKLTNVERK